MKRKQKPDLDFSISMEFPDIDVGELCGLEPSLSDLEPEPTEPPEPATLPLSSKPKHEVEALVTEIRKRLVKGQNETSIIEEMELGRVEYRRLKARLYEQAVDGLAGKTAEQQYVDYCLEQERCVRELDDMVTHFKNSRQFNAMIGAVRAKSQILGDIHKIGVSMGVIKQEVSYDREVAGVRINDLENHELREAIANELKDLKSIIDRFGDQPITEVEEPSPMADPTVKRVKQ